MTTQLKTTLEKMGDVFGSNTPPAVISESNESTGEEDKDET